MVKPDPRWFGQSARFTVGTIVAAGHAVMAVTMSLTQADGAWQATMFVVDFPFSLLWLWLLRDVMDPLTFFAMVGSAWWFQLAYGLVWAIGAVIPRDDGSA